MFMQRLNPDDVAAVLIPHFLRLLMKSERERIDLVQKDASVEAEWPASQWGALERGARPIDKSLWIRAADVLGLTPTDVVRHMNTYILRNPSIWIEVTDQAVLSVCERPVTSPRVIRSGHMVSVDLNPIRPILFHELSSYAETAADIIGAAVAANAYVARETFVVPSQIPAHPIMDEDRRERVVRIINELSPEKFGLMERIVDKFTRYTAKQLAVAYQHFSISVKHR